MEDLVIYKERLFRDHIKNGECIESRYARPCFRYPLMKFRGGNIPTHRVSWILHHGEIKGGLWVLHKCDNPKCINIDHLFLGTALENSLDMRNKKRDNFFGKRKYDQKVVDKCIDMKRMGLSYREIERKTGIPWCSIHSFMRRISLKDKVKDIYGVSKYHPKLKEEMWVLKKSGMKNVDIQKQFNVPKRTLLNIFERFRKIQGSFIEE